MARFWREEEEDHGVWVVDGPFGRLVPSIATNQTGDGTMKGADSEAPFKSLWYSSKSKKKKK